MRKDSFYVCCMTDDGKVIATKVTGYSENDLGVHKDRNDSWIVTHIPTGLRLNIEHYASRAVALKETKKKLDKLTSFEDRVKEHMESETYRAFSDSRYAQSATKAF
jgi:hypothetical protein